MSNVSPLTKYAFKDLLISCIDGKIRSRYRCGKRLFIRAPFFSQRSQLFALIGTDPYSIYDLAFLAFFAPISTTMVNSENASSVAMESCITSFITKKLICSKSDRAMDSWAYVLWYVSLPRSRWLNRKMRSQGTSQWQHPERLRHSPMIQYVP